jgi:pyrimidine-nucleoside phosphorylase
LLRAAELIQRKRDGEALSDAEIAALVLAFTRGEVPDYQMAAFCMAVWFRGMTARETFALTDAMVRSGETIELGREIGRRVVDKHSTGGVGDKATLALGPVVAACGVPFGKMRGRGLGHTGGTLDKLEAIPGYRIELSHEEFVAQVREVGVAVIGQTANLVPADKQLYGLRDVTATVDNVSLIAASIMSKKIAGGADAMVLDVKVGDGAFMKTLEDARELSRMMIDIGRRAGRATICELTDMDQPLGRAVGNALEVREAVEMLTGSGPPDFREIVLSSAAQLLTLSDLGVDHAEARRRAEEAVADGSAFTAYERWIRAQGGDPDPDVLPRAPVVHEVTSNEGGYVTGLGAAAIGTTALRLGAGRTTKDAPIDHAVGVVCRVKRGDPVAPGDVLAEIHAADVESAEAAAVDVRAAYRVGPDLPAPRPIVIETLTSAD